MEIGHDSEMGSENFDSLGGKHLHSHKSPRIDCFLEMAMSFWHSGICIVQIGTFSTGALITYSITPTILKTIGEEIRACGNYHLLCHSKIMTGSGSSENN